MELPASSVEYVTVPVSVTLETGEDVGEVTARLAWPPEGAAPSPADWVEARVLTHASTGQPVGLRRRYQGDLPPGSRTVWAEVTVEGSAEVVLLRAGRLTLAPW